MLPWSWRDWFRLTANPQTARQSSACVLTCDCKPSSWVTCDRMQPQNGHDEARARGAQRLPALRSITSNPDRRTAIEQLLGAALSHSVARRLSLLGDPVPQRERPTGEEHQETAAVERKFMNQFFAPALSAAIVRDGAFVFERPFGPAPTYSASSPAKYVRGWYVRDNGKGNWWHNGSLPGNTSTMVRAWNGLCWGALTKTRTQPSSTINTALGQMVWDMVNKVPGWNS